MANPRADQAERDIGIAIEVVQNRGWACDSDGGCLTAETKADVPYGVWIESFSDLGLLQVPLSFPHQMKKGELSGKLNAAVVQANEELAFGSFYYNEIFGSIGFMHSIHTKGVPEEALENHLEQTLDSAEYACNHLFPILKELVERDVEDGEIPRLVKLSFGESGTA